jgi:hypothetical protein
LLFFTSNSGAFLVYHKSIIITKHQHICNKAGVLKGGGRI